MSRRMSAADPSRSRRSSRLPSKTPAPGRRCSSSPPTSNWAAPAAGDQGLGAAGGETSWAIADAGAPETRYRRRPAPRVDRRHELKDGAAATSSAIGRTRTARLPSARQGVARMRRTTPASHGRAPRCGARSRTRSCSSGALSRSAGPRGPPRGVPRAAATPQQPRGARTGRQRGRRRRAPRRGGQNSYGGQNGHCLGPAVVPRTGAARRPVVDHYRVDCVPGSNLFCRRAASSTRLVSFCPHPTALAGMLRCRGRGGAWGDCA